MSPRIRRTVALAGLGLTGTLGLAAGAALLAACTMQAREAPEPALVPIEAAPAGAVDTGMQPELPPEAVDAVAEPAPSPRSRPATAPAPAREKADASRQQRLEPADVPYVFGGSTYLSNDDSTSLASAQRLLWALQRDQPVAPSQVRKHELLNYFTFDTVPPAPGDVFGVTASAETDGEQLDLALVVQGLEPDPRPLDLTLLIDRSGSMDQDGRMAFTQRGLRLMLDQLRPGDTVDVVAFAAHADVLVEDFVIGEAPTDALAQTLARIHPGGATDLSEGLRVAYDVAASAPADDRRNRRLLLITDAQTNQGVQDAHLLSEVGRHLDDDGIRLTGVGVGEDFDDALLDRLTEKGKGAYVFLGSDAVVDRVFGVGFPALVDTIAHDVRFQLHLPDSLAMKRFHGEAMSTRKRDIQPVHFFAGTSQTFFSELVVDERGIAPDDALGFDITWKDPATGAPRQQHHAIGVHQALDGSPYNVRKARTLMAWSDVVLARAMGADCTEPGGRFADHATGLDDREIAFVADLVPAACRPVDASRGDLAFRIAPSAPYRSAEVRCDDGTRQRRPVDDGVARFADLPSADRCEVRFRGPGNLAWARLEGDGRERVCTFAGGATTCEG